MLTATALNELGCHDSRSMQRIYRERLEWDRGWTTAALVECGMNGRMPAETTIRIRTTSKIVSDASKSRRRVCAAFKNVWKSYRSRWAYVSNSIASVGCHLDRWNLQLTMTCRSQCWKLVEVLLCCMSTADFGFARFLEDGMMAATLCGSPMYMVWSHRICALRIFTKYTTWCNTQKRPDFLQCRPVSWKCFRITFRELGRLQLHQVTNFWNFFGKCLWKNLRRSFEEDFEKGCAIFKTSLETS